MSDTMSKLYTGHTHVMKDTFRFLPTINDAIETLTDKGLLDNTDLENIRLRRIALEI